MKLLSGSSNLPLAQSIAKNMKLAMLERSITRFSNGEIRVHITDPIQNEDVILVQSHSDPTDSMIIETLLLIDALERGGAHSISLIIPWLGYSLQDKVFRDGEPIASRVVASLLTSPIMKRVYLLDLHNASIQGFFDIPTTLLNARSLFTEYAKNNIDMSKAVVASPDFGGLKKAAKFAEELGVDMVTMGKKRDLETGEITMTHLEGDPTGKIVLLFDDVIMSGGTAAEAAKQLKEQGATQVYFFATHGVFVGDALEKLQQSDIDHLVITNSINHETLPSEVIVLDSSSLFCERM